MKVEAFCHDPDVIARVTERALLFSTAHEGWQPYGDERLVALASPTGSSWSISGITSAGNSLSLLRYAGKEIRLMADTRRHALHAPDCTVGSIFRALFYPPAAPPDWEALETFYVWDIQTCAPEIKWWETTT